MFLRTGLTTIRAGILIAIFSCFAFGQSERGTITGVVLDASGAVVPAASITITNPETNVTLHATSNAAGEYTVPSLQPGSYNVRAEKTGLPAHRGDGRDVDAATTVRADVKLEVGASNAGGRSPSVRRPVADRRRQEQRHASEQAGQRSAAGGERNRANAVRSGLADARREEPGRRSTASASAADRRPPTGPRSTAFRPTPAARCQKSWVASNSPSVEAIDQFTVDTNGYKAEYGHAGGGNMTYASKSGTNQFHGSAYEFLRNNDFDANNFFSNRSGIPISIYKQNDFGATVGGPVWIPKVYHGKDKTFFFFSYEGFRNRTGANGTAFTVPTPEMYNGDFSKWVTSAGVHDSDLQSHQPGHQRRRHGHARRSFPATQFPRACSAPASQKALGVFQTSGMLTPNNGAAPGHGCAMSRTTIWKPAAPRSIRSISRASRATTSSTTSTASPATTGTIASTRPTAPTGRPRFPGSTPITTI